MKTHYVLNKDFKSFMYNHTLQHGIKFQASSATKILITKSSFIIYENYESILVLEDNEKQNQGESCA